MPNEKDFFYSNHNCTHVAAQLGRAFKVTWRKSIQSFICVNKKSYNKMRVKSENIFMSVSYKKVFTYSVLLISFGIGFAGILFPKIIRQAMKMVKIQYLFCVSFKWVNLILWFIVATSRYTRHNDTRNVRGSSICHKFSNLCTQYHQSGWGYSWRKAKIARARTLLFWVS